MDEYKIKLQAFEGPMDLLLHLIEKNKIDIYDIPIAELTQQYLDYLDKFREFNIEIASSFLVMAATLLQIKSKLMLPQREEEGESAEDPRLELIERILEYRKFKQMSEMLDSMADIHERLVSRAPMRLPVTHLPPQNLSLECLIEAFRTVVAVKAELAVPRAIVESESFTINEKMEAILSLITRASGRLVFADAFSTGSRTELIVTFLALLELIKLKSVVVRQADVFADIYICALSEGFVSSADK